jgi:uncharacterized phage protein (TIGR02218 family)
MKTLPAGLQTHLDSGCTTLCWCWRVTRSDSVVLGFTDHDRDLTFDGTAFEAATGFTGSDIRQSVGLSVDNLDATGALSSAAITEADLAAGLFDNAAVEIWRVNWADTTQRVLLMSGSVGEVKRGEVGFTAELRSLAHYLGQEKGHTYQYACDADLGDARCKVSMAAHTGSGTVTSVDGGAYLFSASGLDSFADGKFTGGLVTWATGDNAAAQMEVKRHTLSGATASLELWRSMPSAVAIGDTFTVTAGCDKTWPTCRTAFSNGDNFRGFPYIPGNEYVVAVPSDSNYADYDGRSMFNE